MDQRTQFIADYLRQTLSISELCQHYGVSRKTGYKGIDRFLLGCQSLTSTAVAGAKSVFKRIFKEFGLPERIRTDNGVPFATISGRVQSGATARGTGSEHACQLLQTLTVADAGQASPLEYPDRYEVRYVSTDGDIRWNHEWVNVSVCCAGEYVGLEEIDDGVWKIFFGPLKLGRLHERHMRIEDANGSLLHHR